MRILKKLAAAAALAAVISTLTACGKDDPASLQQEPSLPTAGTNPVDTMNSVATAFGEYTVKSKITSADSTAKSFINTINTYIADLMTVGGKKWESGMIKLTVTNGNWTVSGYDVDAYKKQTFKSFVDVFEFEYPTLKDAYAEIHLNESGYAYAAVFSPDGKSDDSEYPDKTAFETGKWKWNGKTVGVTPNGNILGTYPHLFLDEG